jgi:hypothetical protein
MAKKRLAFDVEENLHTLLKQMAAEQGTPLGAFCSALIERGLEVSSKPSVEIDPVVYQSWPLDRLRSETTRLGIERPKDWEIHASRINAEIVKRYVVR